MFGILEAVSGLPVDSNLRHRAFVDWYYSSSDFCGLTLLLDDHDHCLACLGNERMTLKVGELGYRLGCLSSFYAFHPGYGFYGFSAALHGADAGFMLGGTDKAIGFVQRLGWDLGQINAYSLNLTYHEDAGHPLRNLCKLLVNACVSRVPLHNLETKLPDSLTRVQVIEQSSYADDLLDFPSSFAARFDRPVAHFAWRYALDLPFARYRLFKAFLGSEYIGFVILQDMPEQVLVAESSGSEPKAVAAAILRSISAVARSEEDKREVLLLCSNPAMQRIFVSAGFQYSARRRIQFGFGGLKGRIPAPVGPSEWLVNYDLGGRGLHRPFLDETVVAQEPVHELTAAN